MINEENLPKVLIVSRGVWDDTQGTSSTLSNVFQNYNSEKLAMIYIESTLPKTTRCHRFFQISEFSLVRKLYKWRTKTGFNIDTNQVNINSVDLNIANQEALTMNFVRKHRSIWFSFAREILWMFNGWKTKELRSFVVDFNPDVVWIEGSPLPLLHRLNNYVLKIINKPASIFMTDDIYTFQSCSKNLINRMYRYHQRLMIQRVVKQCDNMFVASPKMKREYDKIFGVNSVFITKGVELLHKEFIREPTHKPLRLVYLGQVIYGRIYSLIAIAEALKGINNGEVKMKLDIYTNNLIEFEQKQQLLHGGNVTLLAPVPYSEVYNVISNSDVVVFVESFEKRYRNVARLSFSTKISDYLSSGKCILAVGPSDSAPIEYLQEEDSAIVVTTQEDIQQKLQFLLQDDIITQYAEKSYSCGKRNHEKTMMDERVFRKLESLANPSM